MRTILITLFFLLNVKACFLQVICIDPGHGYGPEGENFDSRTWEEISTNCKVGLLLEDTLLKQGYSVIMTRTESGPGSWMSLTQRAELADSYDTDRLLSIHCNGGGGTGTETFWCYVQSPKRAVDSIFSQIVQDKMVYFGEWRNRRSIEDALYLGFHLGVLKGAAHGCLNEIGFVDTPADLEKLLNNNWRKKFALAYSEAINESFSIEYPSHAQFTTENISCYPNPFTEGIYISCHASNSAIYCYEITDLAGIIVLKGNIACGGANNTYRIPAGGLSTGMYFLRLYNKTFVQAVAVIKQ
ncbi:MAG: N-acetylmuramoyl-L-alanine amidase [Bacteroidales bacterium]|nr:N-acetylmuramoyl-L-alanine amidase [Bacteroidales bacterium]